MSQSSSGSDSFFLKTYTVLQKLVDLQPDLFVISDVTPLRLLDYHNLILVCSTLGRNTWEMEQKDPWSSFLPKMLRIRLEGRKVAIVGLGDHVSYPNNFVDGMGILGRTIGEIGGKLIGETETRDYIFNDSRALQEGKFIGLPLDEDYEADKTEDRVDNWLERIRPELKK